MIWLAHRRRWRSGSRGTGFGLLHGSVADARAAVEWESHPRDVPCHPGIRPLVVMEQAEAIGQQQVIQGVFDASEDTPIESRPAERQIDVGTGLLHAFGSRT